MKKINKVLYAIFLVAMIFSFGCGKKAKNTDTVTDIDGNVYKTVTIGRQVWMAENLKVSRYRNGDVLPNVENDSVWGSLYKGSYCNYDNKHSNSSTYGFLYNWYAVTDERKIAPAGWHVPTDAEWQTLIDTLGGGDVAGGKMKAVTLWNSPNTGATNESGFTAFPGGCRYYDGDFNVIGKVGYFWSASENRLYNAWIHYLGYVSSDAFRFDYYKGAGFSIRCVRD